jgi:hypothetical protein
MSLHEPLLAQLELALAIGACGDPWLVVARLAWGEVHEGPLRDPRRNPICDRLTHLKGVGKG